MGWAASFRSIRAGGSVVLVSVALLALAGCQAASDQDAMAVPSFAAGPPGGAGGTNPYSESTGDQASCKNPQNVWTGRMTSLPNASGNGSAGTGQSVVACFTTRAACHQWLMAASGAANGIIVEDRCSLNTSGS